MGQPKHAGVVLMGTDVVAVDASAARVMGLAPDRVSYLAEAARYLGNIDVSRLPMRGEPLERFTTPFDVLPAFDHLRA
jgi:uncharacterized protein (DUF362 family)